MTEILREAIQNDGRTAYRLGLDAGVNSQQISGFVAGRNTVTVETFARLCEAVGLGLTEAQSEQQKRVKAFIESITEPE